MWMRNGALDFSWWLRVAGGARHTAPIPGWRAALTVTAVLLATAVLSVPTARSAAAGALSDYRDYEPVVVPLSLLAGWNDTAARRITQLNVYRFDGTNLTAIPFQIDKRRKVDLRFNDAPTGAPYSDVCEYGYFDVLYPPPGYSSPFASSQLKPTDELVFMLSDAGDAQASPGTWLNAAAVLDERYEIAVTDPRNGAQRWVYVHVWASTPPDLNTTDYVSYRQDPYDPDVECLPVRQSCGTVTSSPSGTLADHFSLNVHFQENWVTDGLILKRPDGSAYGDVLERFKMAGGGEDENGWSRWGAPRFLGNSAADPQPIDGKIRVIRGVQGAESGWSTTKYEFVYPTALVTRINHRVHASRQVLSFNVHHADELRPPGDQSYLYRETEYTGGGAFLDQIDGVASSFPPSTPAFYDWVEMISRNSGAYEHFFDTPRPVPSTGRQFEYTDDFVRDIWGAHGRSWSNPGNTEDGYLYEANGTPIYDPNTGLQLGNDGGCPDTKDPESVEYNFARFEHTFFAQGQDDRPGEAVSAHGAAYALNHRNPVFFTAAKQTRYVTPPPPPTPCVPNLSMSNTGTGALNAVIDGCDTGGPFIGYLLFRAEGPTGALALYRDLGGATTFIDAATQPGTLYRYALRAYNSAGAMGAQTATTSITALDTTPPAAPRGFAITPASRGGRARWYANTERDVTGYNLYLGVRRGGPYTKLTSIPQSGGSAQQHPIAGLRPMTYYAVATAVDFAGNESAFTSEVKFVPQP